MQVRYPCRRIWPMRHHARHVLPPHEKSARTSVGTTLCPYGWPSVRSSGWFIDKLSTKIRWGFYQADAARSGNGLSTRPVGGLTRLTWSEAVTGYSRKPLGVLPGRRGTKRCASRPPPPRSSPRERVSCPLKCSPPTVAPAVSFTYVRK